MKNQTKIRGAKDIAKAPYAWPGGYPKFMVAGDSGCICAKCVKQNFAIIARATRDNSDDSWRFSAAAINWEDETLTCDNCGDVIESAYGA